MIDFRIKFSRINSYFFLSISSALFVFSFTHLPIDFLVRGTKKKKNPLLDLRGFIGPRLRNIGVVCNQCLIILLNGYLLSMFFYIEELKESSLLFSKSW